MNTDDSINPQNIQPPSKKDDPLINVVDALQKIDDKKPYAKINESSMDDNNGERIQFNEGGAPSQGLTKSRLNPPLNNGGTFFPQSKRF